MGLHRWGVSANEQLSVASLKRPADDGKIHEGPPYAFHQLIMSHFALIGCECDAVPRISPDMLLKPHSR